MRVIYYLQCPTLWAPSDRARIFTYRRLVKGPKSQRTGRFRLGVVSSRCHPTAPTRITDFLSSNIRVRFVRGLPSEGCELPSKVTPHVRTPEDQCRLLTNGDAIRSAADAVDGRRSKEACRGDELVPLI